MRFARTTGTRPCTTAIATIVQISSARGRFGIGPRANRARTNAVLGYATSEVVLAAFIPIAGQRGNRRI